MAHYDFDGYSGVEVRFSWALWLWKIDFWKVFHKPTNLASSVSGWPVRVADLAFSLYDMILFKSKTPSTVHVIA